MNEPTATEAAAQGAKWLDMVYPEWPNVIDISSLNMRSGKYCVLGQIATPEEFDYVPGSLGGYDLMADFLADAERDGVQIGTWLMNHGFTNPASTRALVWNKLDDAWADEIERRR